MISLVFADWSGQTMIAAKAICFWAVYGVVGAWASLHQANKVQFQCHIAHRYSTTYAITVSHLVFILLYESR